MKKLFLSLAAIVGLFAVSCTTDATSDVQVVGEEGVVNFTLQAPTLGSRAINDGKKATELTYAVYDAAWTLLKKETVSFENGSLVKELSLRLVKNKTYNFVFWAQAPGTGYYTANLGEVGDATVTPTVTVNYAAADEANDDKRDAFFGKKLALTVNGTVNETVYLKRPFAQINFGTADTADAKVVGLDIRATGVTTKFTAQAYTTLNLADGTVDGLTTVTYAAAALPSEETTFTTKEGDTYDWLAMNYLLWPDPEVETKEMSLATCTMTISAPGQTDIVVEVPQAPARRNWRTNLVGNLLTEQGNIKVEILPTPEGEYNPNDVFANQIAKGGLISLNGNIVLNSNPAGFTIDKDTEINLNGFTITLPDVAESDRAKLFTVTGDANLTLTNGSIEVESTNHMTNGTGTSTGGSSVVYSESTGKVVLDNLNIVGSQRGGHRVADIYAGEIEVNNCNISVNYGAGVVVGSNTKGVINDCDITVIGMYSAPYNSVCFGVWGGGELTVNGGNYKMINNNTYSTGDTHGGWLGIVMSSGGTLILNDGNFENVPAAGFNPQYERAIIEAENNAPAISKVVFAGGNYKPQEDTIYAGYGDQYYPTWVNTDKLADTDGDGWYTIEDNKGYVVDGGNYLVSTGAGLATAVVDAPATANISLTTDVDLTGVEYAPRAFSNLVFDGNGYTISGIEVVGESGKSALFADTDNFDIKNVTISNSTFVATNATDKSESAAGALIGFMETHSNATRKLSNCHVVNCTIGSGKYVGGLVGYKDGNYPLEIENCSVKNSTIVSNFFDDNIYKGHCGGLVGYFSGTGNSITNCVVEGNIFEALGNRCGLFIGSAQADYPVSGSVSNNTGLTKLCGEINNIVDWSNVLVEYKAASLAEVATIVANAPAKEFVNIVLPAGTYEGTLSVPSNKYVSLSSTEGAVINGLIYGFSYSRIALKGLTLENPNKRGTGVTDRDQTNTCVGAYCADYTIEDCVFELANTAYGIYIGAAWIGDTDGYSLRVKDCTFNCGGNRPIWCRSNCLIDNCTFNDQYRYSVQIRFNPQDASEKVTFTNNKIVNPCVTSGKGFAAGITVKTSDEVKDVVFDIAGNTMQSELFAELLHVYDNTNVANLHLDTCTIPDGVTFVPEP